MKKLALLFLLVTCYSLLVTAIYADIPRTINYQGKLTDKQGYALDGSYNITFKLYDAATGGNLLWQEAHSGVSVSKGLFNLLLGTITPLNLAFDKPYYLGIKVGADPEMTPRQQLASAPYAFRSESTEGAVTSIFKKFGGDGSQGDVTINLNTNFSTIDDTNRPGIAQFTNLTIDATKTLTVDTGFAYIGVSGTCTISGTINADGEWALGGANPGTGDGFVGQRADKRGGSSSTRVFGSIFAADIDDPIVPTSSGLLQFPLEFCVAGAGGGGGGANQGGSQSSGGCGGGAGSYGGKGAGSSGGAGSAAIATSVEKILRLTGSVGDNVTHTTFFNPNILMYGGAGGGSGGGQTGGAGQGKPGGNGGGIIYIECNALVFNGTLTAKGKDGEQSNNTAWGSGGGGGGGVILVRAKNIITNLGVVTVTGGAGGGIQAGGNGAAGFKDIIQIE